VEEWDNVLAMITSTQMKDRIAIELTQGTKCTADRKKIEPKNQTKAAKAKACKNRKQVGRRLAVALYGCITWTGTGYG
jgi:hypothetical protein